MKAKVLLFIGSIGIASLFVACGENPKKEYIPPNIVDEFFADHQGIYDSSTENTTIELQPAEQNPTGMHRIVLKKLHTYELTISPNYNQPHHFTLRKKSDYNLNSTSSFQLSPKSARQLNNIQAEGIYITCTLVDERYVNEVVKYIDKEDLPKNTTLPAKYGSPMANNPDSNYIIFTEANTRSNNYSYKNYKGWQLESASLSNNLGSILPENISKSILSSDLVTSVCGSNYAERLQLNSLNAFEYKDYWSQDYSVSVLIDDNDKMNLFSLHNSNRTVQEHIEFKK